MRGNVSTEDFAQRLRAADIDRYLATLYAPMAARPALFALHALDLELMEVVRTTTQPMIGLVRLAWWREALERLDRSPPPAQPLLQAIATEVLPCGVSGAMLSEIEAGYAVLLEEPLERDAYLDGRGGALFAAMATVVGGNVAAARAAGRIWAAAELRRFRPGEQIDLGVLPTVKGAPPTLRGLAALARRDLASAQPGPRGTAGRQLRLFWSIFSGG